jgi:hypothetical protein
MFVPGLWTRIPEGRSRKDLRGALHVVSSTCFSEAFPQGNWTERNGREYLLDPGLRHLTVMERL